MPENTMDNDDAKRRAGLRAASFVESGMLVGLGTGTTTEFAIRALGERVAEDGLRMVATPTSYATERLARELRIPLATLDEIERLDVAIDGADEVDPAFNLIKGGGGAHSREKVVAALADRFIILVDGTKIVRRLGEKAAVPVEIIPMAAGPVGRALRKLGGSPRLREGGKKVGPVVTDQGMWLLDCTFPPIEDPAGLAAQIKSIPGVLDHGMFVDMATDVLIGSSEGVEHRTKSDAFVSQPIAPRAM